MSFFQLLLSPLKHLEVSFPISSIVVLKRKKCITSDFPKLTRRWIHSEYSIRNVVAVKRKKKRGRRIFRRNSGGGTNQRAPSGEETERSCWQRQEEDKRVNLLKQTLASCNINLKSCAEVCRQYGGLSSRLTDGRAPSLTAG